MNENDFVECPNCNGLSLLNECYICHGKGKITFDRLNEMYPEPKLKGFPPSNLISPRTQSSGDLHYLSEEIAEKIRKALDFYYK